MKVNSRENKSNGKIRRGEQCPPNPIVQNKKSEKRKSKRLPFPTHSIDLKIKNSHKFPPYNPFKMKPKFHLK